MLKFSINNTILCIIISRAVVNIKKNGPPITIDQPNTFLYRRTIFLGPFENHFYIFFNNPMVYYEMCYFFKKKRKQRQHVSYIFANNSLTNDITIISIKTTNFHSLIGLRPDATSGVPPDTACSRPAVRSPGPARAHWPDHAGPMYCARGSRVEGRQRSRRGEQSTSW